MSATPIRAANRTPERRTDRALSLTAAPVYGRGMTDADRPKGERIAKLLARAGVASRREAERMIADGRVKIGDEVLTTPATVLENLRGVTVDGKPLQGSVLPLAAEGAEVNVQVVMG